MKKTSQTPSSLPLEQASKPVFALSVLLRVLAVLIAVFCLYRLLQLVGGNNIALTDQEIRANIHDAGGKTLYTSSDLRADAGRDPETADLGNGYTCTIQSKKNARKKFIQVSLSVLDSAGQEVYAAEQEPLQIGEGLHAEIGLAVSGMDTGSISASTSVEQKEALHIDHYRWLYMLGAVAGIGGFFLVGSVFRYLRVNTRVARFNRRMGSIGRYALLAFVLVIALFPILWMLFASLLPSQRVMQIPPVFGITGESSFANYVKVFSQAKYLQYYLNSIITSGGTVLVVMFIALLASYSFSRYNFVGKNTVLTLILSVQMFPIVAILISLYGFYMRWNLVNQYAGVILADTVQELPLAIMLLRSFFDTLPRSLDESARIDGAGRLRTMFSILVPLTIPGLVAVGIYTFLNAWDDYLMALTIMKSDEMKTLTVGLAQSFLGEYAHDYGALMAFAMGGSLPIVLTFIFFQKYMISGLTAGAVKG